MTTELVLKISADTKGIGEVKEVLKDIKATVGSSSALAKAFKDLKRDGLALRTAMADLSGSLNKVSTTELKVSKSSQKLRDRVKSLEKENRKLTQSVTKLDEKLVRLNKTKKKSLAANKTLEDGFRGAAGAAGKLWFAYGKLIPMVTGFALATAAIGTAKASVELEYITANIKALNPALAESTGFASDFKKQLLEIEGLKGPRELAVGIKVFTKAGFDVAESMKAIKDTTLLAELGELDLASAVKFTTRTLRTFGLEEDKLSHVTGVLAYTASSAQMEVSDMGAALAYSTELASGMGFGLEEVSAALAILHDKGIAASMAGTSLRTSFIRMAEPTGKTMDALYKLGVSVVDTEGKQKSMVQIVADLSQGLKGLSKTSRIGFLKDIAGIRAFKSLQELIVAFDEGRLEEKLADINREADTYLSKAGDILGESAIGQWKELLTELEKLSIALGDLVSFPDALKTSLEGVKDFASDLLSIVKILNMEAAENSVQSKFSKAIDWLKEAGTSVSESGVGQMVQRETDRPSPALDIIKWTHPFLRLKTAYEAITGGGAVAAAKKFKGLAPDYVPTEEPDYALATQGDDILPPSKKVAVTPSAVAGVESTKLSIAEEFARLKSETRIIQQKEAAEFNLFQAEYEQGFHTRAEMITRESENKINAISNNIMALEEEWRLNTELSSPESVLPESQKKKYLEKNKLLEDTLEAQYALIENQEKINDLIADQSGLAGAKSALRDYISSAADDFTTFKDLAEDAFQTAEDALVSFATGGKVSFKDMANSIIADITRIIAKKMIASLFEGSGGGSSGGGGSGGWAGLAVNFIAGLFHNGGTVGGPSMSRSVNPGVFANATRYHDGLKSDEFPAILQRGEEVTSKSDVQKQRTEAEPGADQGVKIINVIDPAMVKQYMSTSEGSKVVLNIIQSNATQVKGLIGQG